MIRHAQERLDGSTLIVELNVSQRCAGKRVTDVVELARAELERSEKCPAGQVLLEGYAEGPVRALLPEFGERLERLDGETRIAIFHAFSELFATEGVTYGRAFVVNCTTPTLLFFGTGVETRTRVFRVPPPPPTPKGEQLAAAPLEPEPLEPEPLEPEPLEPEPLVTGECHESLEVGKTMWLGRDLSTGLMSGPSSLSTWTLGRSG
jgi:hypothetical protein